MKNLYLLWVVLVCALRPVPGNTQNVAPFHPKTIDKPRIFIDVPDREACKIKDFAPFFRARRNDRVELNLSNQLQISGQVAEKVQVNPQVLSMNIHAANIPGALVTLTEINQPGKPVEYRARIIHPQRGDFITISKEADGYIIRKEALKYFMTE